MKSKIAFSAGLTGGVLVALSATLVAGQVTGLITFVSGTAAKAADVNANFTAVKTAVDDNAAKLAKFGTTAQASRAGNGATCTLGEILLFAGTVANGTPAQGQLLSIAQNQALFALLGTNFGGNGVTTFALPDLRGLAPNGLTYAICDAGIFPSSR
jgi:tail collar domain